MQSVEEHGLIIIRLFPGEDLFQSLQAICRKHKVSTAIVVSAIGQIKQFALGYFDGQKYLMQDYIETHELLSISGMISRSEDENEYKYHLHAVVGNERQQVFGAHLFKGIVEVANEIVLLKTDIPVKRKKDEKTGLQSLYLE